MDVEQVSPEITKILGQNPGPFTLQGTNTYLVGSGKERLLVDTGEGKPEYLELLNQVLVNENCTITHILISHAHPDHIGGLADVLSLCPDAHVYVHSSKRHMLPQGVVDSRIHELNDGKEISLGSVTIKAVYTPGHTLDHFCFLLNELYLLTGDCILGQGSSIFVNLKLYLESLSMLLTLKQVQMLLPGHGPLVQGNESVTQKINDYVSHRLQREQQILDVIQERKKASINEIMASLYNGTLSERVRRAAIYGVALHLEKLEQEGAVKRDEFVPMTVDSLPSLLDTAFYLQ